MTLRRLTPRLDPALLQDGVVVGVSGGIDSVVLLDLLARWRQKHGGRVVVAHVNYGLRRAADADARFVQALATARALPCQIHRARGKPTRGNVQAWAREVRYRFFAQVAAKRQCRAVAVAHQADDQAETVLWHLLRGTGLSGLTGMAPMRELVAGIQLVRPLLHHTRDEIAAYAGKHALRWRQDHTNRRSRYTRTRIRHDLLPQCDALIPGAVRHIADLAARLAPDAAWLDAQAAATQPALQVTHTAGGVRWGRVAFSQLPDALQPRCLQQLYRACMGNERQLLANHLGTIIALASRAAHEAGRYALPGGCLFRCEGPYCFFDVQGALRAEKPRVRVNTGPKRRKKKA